jgi:maltose O-acetyltransferase
MRQRRDAGDWYQCDAKLVAQIRAAQRLALEFEQTQVMDPAKGRKILQALLGSVGNDVLIRAPLWVDYGKNLHIGDRSFANFGLIALDVAPIRIRRKVQIGTNVQLLTPIHHLDPALRAQGWEAAAPITI